MPKRPREHIIGDEARIEFEKLVNDWIFTVPTDYGIDGIVEITEDEHPTGKAFNIQLKGTDEADINKALKFSFEIDMLKYYHQCESPVLLIRYLTSTKEFYYIWAREIDLYYDLEHKTKLIKFPIENKLNCVSLESIKKDIESFYRLKRKEILSLSKPIILMSPRIASKLNKSLLEVRLISDISKDIKIDSIGIDNDTLIIELKEKELIIRCTKFYAIHIDNFFNNSSNIEKVSIYISFYSIFLMLILTKNFDYLAACISRLITNKIVIPNSMYWSLLDISFGIKHFEQSYVLLENGIKEDIISVFDEEIFINIFSLICEINDRDIVNKIMSLIEETILSALIDERAKARTCYNLGNKYRCIVQDHKKAIHLYNMASKYDKSYKERDYFNSEIGNSLFLLDKFVFASYFFAKSFFSSPKPVNLFYLADSKLYSGKYKEANCYLQDVINNEENKEIFYYSEAILKEVFSRYLYENYTEEQNRNIMKAYEVFDDKMINFETMIMGLEYDYLNSTIWFNLGILYSKDNRHDFALLAFIFSALLKNNDYESYLNAIISFLNIENCQEYYQLFYTLLLNGYLHNGKEFELELLTMLSESLQDNQLVDLFYDILKSIKEKIPEKSHLLRYVPENVGDENTENKS